MATYRYGTPSPLGIHNDREFNDQSPNTQDPFHAGSGHTPLTQPLRAPTSYDFPQHSIPPLDGRPTHGAPNNYNYPNPNPHLWQESSMVRDQIPNPYRFPQHAPPEHANNFDADERRHRGSIAAMEQAFDGPGGVADDPDDEQVLKEAGGGGQHFRGIAKPLRLGRATVMCLIFNRMIGV